MLKGLGCLLVLVQLKTLNFHFQEFRNLVTYSLYGILFALLEETTYSFISHCESIKFLNNEGPKKHSDS